MGEPIYNTERYKYTKHAVKTASGKRAAVDNGDPLSEALRGKDAEFLSIVAGENGIDFSKWDNLNLGMKRMNFGNSLRALYRNNGFVVVDGVKIENPNYVEGAKKPRKRTKKSAEAQS